MPKCPYYRGVRIKRALRKRRDKCFISASTKGDISKAAKGFFNVTGRVTLIRSNLKPYAYYKSQSRTD